MRFGVDLLARPVSDFRDNEFDVVDHDIRGVASKILLRALKRGEITIRTVSEYCDYMVQCYEARPQDVAKLLAIPLDSPPQSLTPQD